MAEPGMLCQEGLVEDELGEGAPVGEVVQRLEGRHAPRGGTLAQSRGSRCAPVMAGERLVRQVVAALQMEEGTFRIALGIENLGQRQAGRNRRTGAAPGGGLELRPFLGRQRGPIVARELIKGRGIAGIEGQQAANRRGRLGFAAQALKLLAELAQGRAQVGLQGEGRGKGVRRCLGTAEPPRARPRK